MSSDSEQQQKTEDRIQVFQALDRRDENQILAEMRGEILDELVYDATIQGRRVTNLSYAGVKEAIRHRGNIEILDVHTEETETEIRAMVKVRDLQNRIDVIGASVADKNKPFAYTLAINKAERNAFAKLIPAKWLATLVDDYLTRMKASQQMPKQSTETNPPSQTPKTETQASVKVPITKDPLKIEGLQQFPMTDGLNAVGMINVLSNEISIVPETPISAQGPSIKNFLVSKVLEPMKAKHGFDFTITTDQSGSLIAIIIKGAFSEQQIKELQSSARWAFMKALEKKDEAAN